MGSIFEYFWIVEISQNKGSVSLPTFQIENLFSAQLPNKARFLLHWDISCHKCNRNNHWTPLSGRTCVPSRSEATWDSSLNGTAVIKEEPSKGVFSSSFQRRLGTVRNTLQQTDKDCLGNSEGKKHIQKVQASAIEPKGIRAHRDPNPRHIAHGRSIALWTFKAKNFGFLHFYLLLQSGLLLNMSPQKLSWKCQRQTSCFRQNFHEIAWPLPCWCSFSHFLRRQALSVPGTFLQESEILEFFLKGTFFTVNS